MTGTPAVADAFWAAAARSAAKGAPAAELADVMNGVLMDRLGIRTVWSYDRDYERLGYERVG